MNKIKKWSLGVIVVIILIIFVLLGNRNNGQNSVTKVGVILPLTGQYASIGESVKKGMELSVGDLNDASKSKIKFIFEDDKYNSKDALSAYQKLTQLDQVDILVSLSSPTVEIVKPEVNKSHQLMLILADEISHEKDSVFQLMPQGSGLFSSLATEAGKLFKSIMVFYSSDNNLFKNNSDIFAKSAPPQLKVSTVPVQANSDFRTEVSQLINSDIEAYAIFLPFESGVKVLNEISKYKLSKIKLLCDANIALTIQQYVEAVGKDIFEGCVSTTMSETKTPEFVNMYKIKYGTDPQFASDFGYDAVQIINKLASNNKEQWFKLLDNKFSYQGVSGNISFDKTGTREPYTEVSIFKNGKFVKLEE